mmetsp:Transcript_15260/g.32953  ORF Transcript_15260/g.32953 Transcript_15260/m.32953 type:complete len:422 (-) Transcript_15260:288-1553(-)|eukprot:CAMPEP_0206491160 /NCGR_PEP_ID=MMETSP0324_2-20121206/44736_1 /ASSEMBLY_ACC=CAM_ASM_000836 /TAXON_ID=2866 /ORGANISM="Crypthecodinium cohnii, Strain Seligo" /LENGTH=421 /DNA_ID=CAMNT_0053972109 /DNA_START=9 /DNA_END=1274 /DNA_ORIENTATION=+
MAVMTSVEREEDLEEWWDDWCPPEQTALDFIKAAEAKKQEEEEDNSEEESEEEDSDDDWNPIAQQACEKEDGEDEDSDDEWAPQAQGAADTKQSEQEALENLLKPVPKVPAPPPKFETKKEADAAGRMLYEMKRPPTVEEAKAEIPRGPGVDVDSIPAPEYREMKQEEAIAMVSRGASVNWQGQHGRSPLHKACEYAYPILVKALCDAGADLEVRDQYGETPLLYLAHSSNETPGDETKKSRRSETIQMMLKCGADIHAVNPRGRGVLHLACCENDQQAIETLIEGQADPNAQDLAGFTSLMWAAGRNSVESVKMLLDYEADMNLKAARGQTAMTFALTNGCNAIVDILERHKMILDAEEAKRIKEQGERDGEEEVDLSELLQLPKPDWACKTEKPAEVQPYAGRRVYKDAKPDRHSNVYV